MKKRLNADYGLMSSTNSFPLLPEAHLKVFSHMATLLHSIRLYCIWERKHKSLFT